MRRCSHGSMKNAEPTKSFFCAFVKDSLGLASTSIPKAIISGFFGKTFLDTLYGSVVLGAPDTFANHERN